MIYVFPHIAMPAPVFGIAIYGLITGEINPDDLKPREKKKEEYRWDDWEESYDPNDHCWD